MILTIANNNGSEEDEIKDSNENGSTRFNDCCGLFQSMMVVQFEDKLGTSSVHAHFTSSKQQNMKGQ